MFAAHVWLFFVCKRGAKAENKNGRGFPLSFTYVKRVPPALQKKKYINFFSYYFPSAAHSVCP